MKWVDLTGRSQHDQHRQHPARVDVARANRFRPNKLRGTAGRPTRIGISAMAGFLTLIAGAVTSCQTSHPASNTAPFDKPIASEVRSQKPDLSAINPTMMVGRESFPADAVGDWKPPYMYEEYYGGGSDEGCDPITDFWERGKDSHALASLDATPNPHELRYRVDLILPKNRNHRDIASVVDACQTFEFNDHTVRVERQSVADVPAWAAAFKLELMPSGETQSWVMGQFRGIDVKVSATNAAGMPDPMPAVAKLFNDQVAKLEDQPS